METEVHSLKQDKAKLLDLVGTSTHLRTTSADSERPSLLPLPSDYYPNFKPTRGVGRSKSPNTASTTGSALQRLGSQNTRTSRNTRNTSSAQRGQTSNARTVSSRRTGPISRPLTAGSDYAAKHLQEKTSQGSNSWNLTRSTPSWKP